MDNTLLKTKTNKTNYSNEVKIDVSKNKKAIMISRLCNNKCLMCHSDTNYAPDYNTQTIIDAIKKNVNGSEKQIQISGGEPTVRNDLIEIISEIKKQNPFAEIQLNTNCRMFSYSNFTNKISKLIDFVMTEIHGSSSEIHDKITQVKGSFDQTIKGIKNLIKQGIKVNVIVLINKINYKDVENISQFIKNNFPEVITTFEYTWFMRHGFDNKDKLFINVSEIPKYLEKAIDILQDKCHLMHFPLCIFNTKYQKYIVKQSFVIDDREIYPMKKCNSCLLKNNCNGIWKNYMSLGGNIKEFKPRTKNIDLINDFLKNF